MSSRSRLTDSHYSTLHAFFLAAKESGYTEFDLRLLTRPKGRVEFCMSPREHSEISANFEVRGNMVVQPPAMRASSLQKTPML